MDEKREWGHADSGHTDRDDPVLPIERREVLLTGGLGIGSIRADLGDFGSETEVGGGALLGLGYDIRIADNTSLTAYWNGFAARTGDADVNVGQIGLSITAH